MTTQDRSVLGRRLARPLDELEIERIAGANPQWDSRCAFPYMETSVGRNGLPVCDPCDDVGFP